MGLHLYLQNNISLLFSIVNNWTAILQKP